MKVIRTEIPEVLILEPKVFEDPRGFFLESYNRKTFMEATGLDVEFVQDNHSRSGKNVLRGLHYQIGQPQGKLIRVTFGEVWDVAVDLRKSSSTFGKWVGFHLKGLSKQMAWIPPGFAHGFVVISADRLRIQFANLRSHFIRIRAVADHVAQADDAVPATVGRGQGRF